jgi:hypothetical protein
MSAAPRAARGGKKVNNNQQQQSPSNSNMMMGEPTNSMTPPTILSEGPVDLSSFLSQAANINNNSTSTTAASSTGATAGTPFGSSATISANGSLSTISSSTVGVVRGRARDNQTSIKERDPGVKQSEVESKLRESFATIVNKSEKSSNSAASDEALITPEKINENAVSLVAETHVHATALKLLKADDKARVLIVTSLEDIAFSTAANSSANDIKIGSFYGAEKQVPATASELKDVRLWYTTFRAVISFLNVFVRDHEAVCPFTHIAMVARDGKCSPLFDSALSVLSHLIFASSVGIQVPVAEEHQTAEQQQQADKKISVPKPRGKRPTKLIKKAFGADVKIILGGVNSVDEVKNSISAADKSFTLAAGSLIQTELKHTPVHFSAFDAAALAGTMVKEHAPSSVSLRRLPGAVSSLPQSLIEHGVTVSASVVVKAVQLASAEKLGPLRCAVIGAEQTELQTAIKTALPADSFVIYNDAKEFLAADAAGGNSKKTAILLIPRAVSTHVASQLKLHLVVDSGTERRAQIPPQAEMQFPIKVVLAPTKREANSRKSMAGWCEDGPGVFFTAADFMNNKSPMSAAAEASSPTAAAGEASSPARGVDNVVADGTSSSSSPSSPASGDLESAEEEDLLEPVCDAVLALAQNGLELTHLVRDTRKSRDAQLQLAIPFLTDLGYIVAQPGGVVVTTFLGEIATRSGLPPDFARIVINGLAVGMADAAAFVATAAARPFRSSAHQQQQQSDSSSSSSSGNEFGDTIEDAITLAEGAAAEDVKKYLASRKAGSYPIHAESFESAIRVVKVVQKGIEDFIISTPSAPSRPDFNGIKKQINENVNLLVAFVASALARRAVVVRHEGDDRINTISRGNLLFTHTAKEVVPNRFLHSGATWTKDMIIICSSIQNTPTRLLGSGCTGVSNDYFMGCLFTLSPTIAFEQAPNNQVSFSVALNRLEKTSLVPQQLADQLLNLREQWKTLMSYVQLRRATGAKSASAFKELSAKHLDKRFNLEKSQAEYVAELTELINDFHVTVPLGSSAIGRDLSKIRTNALAAPAPPSTLASIAVPSDFAVAKEVATMVASVGTTNSTANSNQHSAPAAAAKSTNDSKKAVAEQKKEESDNEEEETDVIIDDD